MFYLEETLAPAWQWVYLVNIILATCMLLSTILLDSIPRSKIRTTSPILLILISIGGLYLFAFPFNFYLFLILQFVMKGLGAPLGAIIISMAFGALAWFLAFTTIMRIRVTQR